MDLSRKSKKMAEKITIIDYHCNMKRIISSSLIFIALCFSASLSADEGMWMVGTAKPSVKALARAVVSIDFMGTGSFVSDDGLVITNHHVAYADVFALGDKQHNYLEDGFWALRREDELPVKGRKVQILKETIDVTAEVDSLIASGSVKQGMMMMRKLSGILETRYKNKTGLEAILSSMWRGAKYYIALYEEYSDVRLVAAPPVSIAAFGGDVDNWEWPQHKGDFAMYRVYTAPDGKPAKYSPENVPLKSPAKYKISTKGYREGSASTIIGFPGKTQRYIPAARVEYLTEQELPVVSKVRNTQMEIISAWMDRDPEVRRLYSDFYFGLSNFQELSLGQMQCNRRFGVVATKRAEENRMQEWIDADPGRKARWGNLLSELDAKSKAVEGIQKDLLWYRECIARGVRLSAVASRTQALKRKGGQEKVDGVRKSSRMNYAEKDLRVERDLFKAAIKDFLENISPERLGPFQKEVKERFGNDYDAMCAFLWDGSWMTDPDRIAEYLDPAVDMEARLDDYLSDPLVRFLEDTKMSDFSTIYTKLQGKPNISDLSREYGLALYEYRKAAGIEQYPDANSTMRINYGHVKGYSKEDGINCRYYTTAEGLLAKHNPEKHDFCMLPGWKSILETADPAMKIDFLTDNDSTGGNSGSPVLNKKGELIGLLFDGVKESLATDFYFTKDYNRSVCVDIRYVMWVLKNYGRMDSVLSEMGVK